MTSGTIFKIKKFAIHDGPGIRTTVFLKGCPLKCFWCHNPESQKFMPETAACDSSGRCMRFGEEKTVQSLMAEIMKDVIFFDESGGGVTFSGGEPLSQPEFLKDILTACRKMDIDTAVDTCGYAPFRSFEGIMGLTDLFLYDLKLIDEKAHITFTGVSNRPILENLEKLSGAGKKIFIRFPLIPGITDTRQNIEDTVEFIKTLPRVSRVDVLPYHRTGDHKYALFEMENRMNGVMPPEEERISEVAEMFRCCGIPVKVGG